VDSCGLAERKARAKLAAVGLAKERKSVSLPSETIPLELPPFAPPPPPWPDEPPLGPEGKEKVLCGVPPPLLDDAVGPPLPDSRRRGERTAFFGEGANATDFVGAGFDAVELLAADEPPLASRASFVLRVPPGPPFTMTLGRFCCC